MPDWTPHVRSRLVSLRLPPTREREIVEELSQHLDDRWQELIASGLPEAEATEWTLAGFQAGDFLARELGRLRQAHAASTVPPGVPGRRLLADLGQDLRHAWRLLWRRPAFTAAATLTLAFAIGANTAIFGLVDAVLMRPLPVERPDRLVLIEQVMARGATQNLSRPLFEYLRDAAPVFAGVCAAQDGFREVVMGTGAGVETVKVQAVSGEYFAVLGTSAFIGRTFGAEDDRTPGGPPIAVVSHTFWRQRLGADPGVVGRTIPLAGQPFTVVGVARPGFFGEAVGRAPEIWVPMMMHPALGAGPSLLGDPRTGWLTVVARLQPDVTRQQADAALAVVLDRLKADPGSLGGMPPLIAQLAIVDGSQGKARLREQFSLPLRVLSGAVALLLLIACANVATMLLARASARQREIAIRVAIGADRRRLVRQLLTESLLLGAMGGALGLALSWCGSRLLLLMAGQPGQPIDIDVTPDVRLLAFNALVSVGAVMLFGLAPALSASRADVHAVMRTMPGRPLRRRFSPLLVVAQVALSLPLIAGAALLLQTLHNLRTRDLGFAADSLVQVHTNPQASGYTPERLPALTGRLVERLGALPGVRAVSVAHSGFGTGTSSTCCIAIPGRVFASERERDVRMIGVGPNYFSTVGQRLRIGRDFAPGDLSDDPSGRTTVAIVNEAFVRQFLPAGSPIGQHFGWGDPPKVSYDIEVVGVVDDAVYDDVRAAGKPLIYFPSATGRLYLVRAQGPPARLVGSLRRELQAIDPALVVTVVAPVMEDVERALVREALLARLAGVFGVAAAALAGLGLYGLMAFTVATRTRDIGVCLALGAPPDRIMRSEVWSALRLVALGLALGLPPALAAGRLVAAQLYDVSAADPLTLVAAAGLLTVVGGLAAYGPARRAARVDPLLALRAE
jgi:predicted permease